MTKAQLIFMLAFAALIGLIGTVKMHRQVNYLEYKLAKVEGAFETYRAWASSTEPEPAELKLEMQDSSIPGKVYTINISGTTGTMGSYELDDVRIREDAP